MGQRSQAARAAASAGAGAGRTQHALKRAGRQFVARCGHVLSRLGLQVSAVLYLLFAASFGYAGVTAWMADHAHHGFHAGAEISTSLTQAAPITWIELLLALVFAYFGISSLARAAARRP